VYRQPIVGVAGLTRCRHKKIDGEREKPPMLLGFRMNEVDYESLNDKLEVTTAGSGGARPDSGGGLSVHH